VLEFLKNNWKIILAVILGVWIIVSIIYFMIKFDVLKKRKRIKLTEDTVIIYNDKLEEPPI